MGSYQINAFFKDVYYSETDTGKVIVTNYIYAPNDDGYFDYRDFIRDQNLDEYIRLNNPSESELIKIISKKTKPSGEWEMMLNKYLSENP